LILNLFNGSFFFPSSFLLSSRNTTFSFFLSTVYMRQNQPVNFCLYADFNQYFAPVISRTCFFRDDIHRSCLQPRFNSHIRFLSRYQSRCPGTAFSSDPQMDSQGQDHDNGGATPLSVKQEPGEPENG
jgi:hypothetical protein